MSLLRDWLSDQLWWVMPTGVAAILLVVLIIAIRFLGWSRVQPFFWPALGLLAALFGFKWAKAQGERDRKDQERDAQDRAEKVVDEKRDEISKLPDAELDKRVDRWTKS